MINNALFDIVLLRHAQSNKNLKGVNGGNGESLTLYGQSQASLVCDYILNNINVDGLKIFSSSSVHTQETAHILSKKTGISVETPLSFKPLDLGIAEGINDDELMVLDYKSYVMLQEWRAKRIDIKDLLIPGIESYVKFWERGNSLINHISHSGSSILVCSNSLMILLTHVMLNHNPINTSLYKHIDIKNCGIIAFQTSDYKSFVINKDLTNTIID